jgi:hypothetical protein
MLWSVMTGLMASLFVALAPHPAAAQQPTRVDLEAGFLEGLTGPAMNLSGISCLEPVEGRARCLVVNDESTAAQWATLVGRRLIPGAVVPLITPDAPQESFASRLTAFGSLAASTPTASGRCRDRDADEDFDEFDGEGVAWSHADRAFYVIGSHACGRRGRFRRSTHLLARIRTDAAGGSPQPPELTWRLGEAILHHPLLAPYYGLPRDETRRGLDIEGIAVTRRGLMFGLRAPSLQVPGPTDIWHGLILTAHPNALFSNAGAPPELRIARVPLAPGTGIRDLAALRDGRLLVLTGGTQDQRPAQSILLLTPGDAEIWQPTVLVQGLPEAFRGSKAEGLTVTSEAGGAVTLIVLFEESAREGGLEYVLPVPAVGTGTR